MKRRSFLKSTTLLRLAAGFMALGSSATGKAEHSIMLWLGGGMAQIDTVDPKPRTAWEDADITRRYSALS